MSVTRLEIIQPVLTILDIKIEGRQIFTYQGIISLRKLLNNNDGTYQYMLYKKLSKLFQTDMEQITILWNWHQIFSIDRIQHSRGCK